MSGKGKGNDCWKSNKEDDFEHLSWSTNAVTVGSTSTWGINFPFQTGGPFCKYSTLHFTVVSIRAMCVLIGEFLCLGYKLKCQIRVAGPAGKIPFPAKTFGFDRILSRG
jgi:hypothetical protein